jgi:hypothetical protein
MTSYHREPADEERICGADLHPHHESWARITNRNTMSGFVIFLVLAGLFVLWIEMIY